MGTLDDSQATGVPLYQGERSQLLETTEEDGLSRQAMMVAHVLLEGHKNLGVNLPKEIEDVLAEDARENSEGTKPCQAKLSRR
jgi:hypothetical protein